MFNAKNRKIEHLLIENADYREKAERLQNHNADLKASLKHSSDLCRDLSAKVYALTRKRNEKGQFV